MRSNTKLILSLINRVAVRLPINSGRKLENLEHDPIVQQTVAAIIELSTYKLSTIANALGSVLENISKHNQATPIDHTVSIDVLQSQLFVLRLLSACMQHYWNCYRDQSNGLLAQQHDEETEAAAAATGATGIEASPRDSTEEGYRISYLVYVPPLDDALVTFILALMNRFLNQVHIIEEINDQESPSSLENSNNGSIVDPITMEIILDIYKVAGKVLYYVSASNWSIYYGKIKSAVQVLGSIGDGVDTNPPDIRMLECSCLTRQRLHTVLTELSPYYLHMKRQGKLLYSKMIRRAIWRWIETYPFEFEQVCSSDNRLLGGSEILFDMCSSSADTSKKKAIMWPLQTILLSLSPDLLLQAFLDNPSLQNRRTSFLGVLRKSLKSSRTADIAALCYVDLCKAATYIRPDEDSVLHHIASDIDPDLREKIWSNINDTSTSTLGYSIDHLSLTADYLLTRLRLDTHNTLHTLVPSCLDENAPIRFKLALVKSCLVIAEDDNRLPWNPSLENMYDVLCPTLRKLFIQAVTNELHTGLVIVSPTEGRKGNTELIQDILKLYKLDPLLALLGSGTVEQNKSTMICIANIAQYPDNHIRQCAMDCLAKLHNINNIIHWGPKATIMSNFWSISSQVIFSLARQMLDNKLNEDTVKALLTLMMKLLEARNEFLRKHPEVTNDSVRERLQASISLEIALLVLLCSPNPDICSDVIKCLGYLCDEAEYGSEEEDPHLSQITFISNLPVYYELASEDTVFLGRKAQQKRVRKFLRMMNQPTPGNLAAWEEVWKRWKALTLHIFKLDELVINNSSNSKPSGAAGATTNKDIKLNGNSHFGLDEEKPVEWQNCTGFLVSLGVCCLADDPVTKTENSDRYSDSMHNNHQFVNGTRRMSSPSEPNLMVDKFMAEMITLLVSDHAFIRESVTDALGNDLSPTLYALLFRHMTSITDKLFNASDEPVYNNTNSLFIEQSSLVLKLILDRLVGTNDALLNIEFGVFLNQFSRYVNAHTNNQSILRMKIKLCNLIDTCMSKKEQIVIGNETRLRNKLLDMIKNWTSDTSTSSNTDYQNEKLQRDLDQACLKAMVGLLHRLPLQPLEPVRTTDAFQTKCRLFYSYFEYFMKLLARYRETEPINGNKEVSSSASKETTPLKNYTISAMTNLLNANIDAGLKFSLAMGYHEDSSTRTAFIQVLTNILNQGVEFDTLKRNVTTDRYDKLIDMLVESDMEIALSLCEVCPTMDTNGLAEVLLACFESKHKELSLIKAVIDKEVAATEQEATLLRGTTMGIKIISTFAKMLCFDYVRDTLQPALEQISQWSDSETMYELDPQKLGVNDDINRNKANVIRATELLLDAICASAKNAPRPFREELHLIATAVKSRFPEAKYTAVGGIVILRLFGPAIVSPEHAGFTKAAIPKNNNVRKLLLQATRVIQNLASNILFGSKETHMIMLNDFLTNNIYRVTSFLREISSLPKDTSQEEEERKNTVHLDQNGYIRLHRYLSENIERMTRDLSNRRSKSGATGTHSLLELKRTMDRLSNLLAQLGRPSEISDIGVTHSRYQSHGGNNQQFNEFMKRNAHRDLSAISAMNMFYLGGTSKAGHPVFYLISRNVDAENLDFELAICYMLRVMEPYMNSPFEILFDLTYMDAECEIPIHWLGLFFQLISNWVNDYMVCLCLYNPNTYLRSYFRRFPRTVLNLLVKRVVFALTLPDLYQRIPPDQLRLPKYSADIEKEPYQVFYPVTRQTHFKSTLPVTIKISSEHIQVISVRPIDFVPGFGSVTKDIYHISVLEDIKIISNPKQGNAGEISFKYEHGKAAMVLSSPKSDSMLALLRYNKQNYDRNKPGGIHERPLRPGDVPGRLLSMALLNVGNEDPGIRLAAYNLLYALSVTFRFDMSNQLLNAQDLCIPANSTGFLINISERLAASEPQLTLDFLSECLIGFHKSNEPMRQLCLNYASPWLRNLAIFTRATPDDNNKNLAKTKDIIRLLIELTVSYPETYKHVQVKVWKVLASVDDLINIILDSFIHFSVEHGIGSPQAEAMADTFVTLSGTTIRGKVISRLRKVLQCTSLRPCRHLTDHPAWTEIITLLRFILMLSFNNAGPVKPYLPELFHTVSLLVGTGPIIIRASVHELVVNIIHTLCTAFPLAEDQIQKLRFILNDVCDTKNRIYFGLTKHHASAFTMTPETMSDQADTISLTSLESTIRLLLDALQYGAPSIDIANAWRARWMGLITSTAFQFNPAIQPRSFVALGCLATDEVDDDLIYQILVALRGALAIFNETDASLIISIMMCLSNIIDNLPSSSRYVHSLFWLAISLVEMNHPATFPTAVRFLQSVLRALDANKMFVNKPMAEVLLETRGPLSDVARELDAVNGISFDTHFSFAIAGILFKGVQKIGDTDSGKDVVYECLSTFLEIDCKRCLEQQNYVEAKSLGYLVGLLPLAARNNALRELLQLAGINEMDLDSIDLTMGGILNNNGFAGMNSITSNVFTNMMENNVGLGGHVRLFDTLEIPDNTTGLLLVSFLATLLNTVDNETERLFLYTFLSDTSVAIPEVFALVYESLLPKMNQMAVSSQNHSIIDAVKGILMTACSEPVFYQPQNRKSQKAYLDELSFSALGDPSFGALKTNVATNAQLISTLLERITE